MDSSEIDDLTECFQSFHLKNKFAKLPIQLQLFYSCIYPLETLVERENISREHIYKHYSYYSTIAPELGIDVGCEETGDPYVIYILHNPIIKMTITADYTEIKYERKDGQAFKDGCISQTFRLTKDKDGIIYVYPLYYTKKLHSLTHHEAN